MFRLLLQKNRGKLRDTFIVVFIFISCIPIIGLGTMSLLEITKSHKNNVSELEQQSLRNAELAVSLFFHDIEETLTTNFDTLDSNTLESSTSTWRQTYVQKFAESNKAIREVSLVSPEGKEVAKYSKISTSNTALYFSELPLVLKAKNGEVTLSDVHTTMNGQFVTMAVPWIIDGKVGNVVLAEIDLSSLMLTIENMRLGNTGHLFLFDRQGTRIGFDNSGTDTFQNISTWPRIHETLALHTFNGLSPDDRYFSPLLHTNVIGSTKLVKDISWVLFVEWPITESDSLVVNFRNIILISIFLSIILVIILATFFSNFLVRPIRLLQDAASKIKDGNFDTTLSITTNNELEDLAESFNNMSSGLKRLEELKNEFVYVAAHELRAPVTAIKGYLELVFDGDGGTLTPELEHLLTPVKRSNERLVNLVNDLLKVARSEAGKLEIAITASDIRPEVVAIVDEVKPLANKRNMVITYNKPDHLPDVLVNTGSFKEIIMNFASNAVKYGNDNGIITIAHDVKDGMVYTSIADNGRGMTEEDQRHLFEKFFRAGDVKKTDIEGTGLGLFITKELVEKMGGTLMVSSALGVGTTFTVAFKQS